MSKYHVLTEKILDFIGLDSAYQSFYYQHIPTRNKLNTIILEEMERIYKYCYEHYLTDTGAKQFREILNLPEQKSLEEELAEVLWEPLKKQDLFITKNNLNLVAGLDPLIDQAKAALSFLKEKGLLRE